MSAGVKGNAVEYTLIRSRRRTISLRIESGALVVRAPLHMAEREIDTFVRQHETWARRQLARQQAQRDALAAAGRLSAEELRALKVRAAQEIPARVRYYAPLVGVTYGRVTIRCQRTRWGSCNKKGDLNFNCLLLLAPPEVLDSVVVHELCHRKVMDHSARFYAEVLRVFPDYRRWNDWLKKNGGLLQAMAREE